jgi:hypothetical protein
MEISDTVYRAYNQLHGKDESYHDPPDPHTPVMANAHEIQSHSYGANGQMQEQCQTPSTGPKVPELRSYLLIIVICNSFFLFNFCYIRLPLSMGCSMQVTQ